MVPQWGAAMATQWAGKSRHRSQQAPVGQDPQQELEGVAWGELWTQVTTREGYPPITYPGCVGAGGEEPHTVQTPIVSPSSQSKLLSTRLQNC